MTEMEEKISEESTPPILKNWAWWKTAFAALEPQCGQLHIGSLNDRC